MPIEDRWPLAEVMAAMRDHAAARGQRVTLAYVVLGGVNATPAHARALGALIGGIARQAEPDRRQRRHRPLPAAPRPRSCRVPRRARRAGRSGRAALLGRLRHRRRLRHAGRHTPRRPARRRRAERSRAVAPRPASLRLAGLSPSGRAAEGLSPSRLRRSGYAGEGKPLSAAFASAGVAWRSRR